MTVSAQPLDVLVVGAGIAGLSTAIALGKQGHRVVVCPGQQPKLAAKLISHQA